MKKKINVKIRLTLLFSFLSVSTTIFSQDVITSKSGTKTLCKIDKITENSIEYHLWDNLTGPVFIISLKNIKVYVLEKKKEMPKQVIISEKVVIPETPVVQDIAPTSQTVLTNLTQPANPSVNKNAAPYVDNSTLSQGQPYQNNSQRNAFTKSNTTVLSTNSDLFQQGRNDAKLYYTGYKGAGTGTFLTTFLLSPILGLIPAIACSSTTPNASNFTFPNSALAREPDYISGYMQEAKKKKSGKVWGNFGIGTILVVVAVGLLQSKH